MRIAVAGGNGLIGTKVIKILQKGGHETVVLSRSAGVDLTTGDGLDSALAGVDVVIDVVNISTTSRKKSVEFFTLTTTQLRAAESRAGVKHHVALSIVGMEKVEPSIGYYAGKIREEEIIKRGTVPWTILQATQFHEFAAQLIDTASIGRMTVVPHMTSQPVAGSEVAQVLADLAVGEPRMGVTILAGPQREEMPDMVRGIVEARKDRRSVLALKLPGSGWKAARNGALCPKVADHLGTITFAQWLKSDEIKRASAH